MITVAPEPLSAADASPHETAAAAAPTVRTPRTKWMRRACSDTTHLPLWGGPPAPSHLRSHNPTPIRPDGQSARSRCNSPSACRSSVATPDLSIQRLVAESHQASLSQRRRILDRPSSRPRGSSTGRATDHEASCSSETCPAVTASIDRSQVTVPARSRRQASSAPMGRRATANVVAVPTRQAPQSRGAVRQLPWSSFAEWCPSAAGRGQREEASDS
jgi:hypothetical protein